MTLEHPRSDRACGPLDGLVVADFSRVLAGPYCTMLLADLGATVIKVESPQGDDTRSWVPPARNGVGTYFLSVNRNKDSITLDLTDPSDLELAYAIIDRADVFVENFKPGGLARFGLDAESVALRWPQLIHASITGFGTGPGASMPGYDLLVQAMSGMMHTTGHPDGPPQRSGVAIFDVVTGLHTTIAILAALQERNCSGLGQHVALDLFSSALSGLVNQTTGYAACGNEPMRLGNDHPSLYPYGPFAAADGDIVICCGNDAQFSRLVECLGVPAAANDPRFTTMEVRNAHRGVLRPILEKALQADTADGWFQRLQEAAVPCAPILSVGEGIRYAERLGLTPVVEAGEGESAVPLIKNPMAFSRSEIEYPKAPPALGADRNSIIAWLQSTPALHDLARPLAHSKG
ncbi:MAG: CoA transferase [Corynebacterium sp.]|uniref:CaiB/BaiF CoA transferase family protein n=1 Tax=Corynebacterium sp. TaxID=1720 RepID=UPI0026DEB861|nr:CoA transferase [Corynebacterium sp.]MDO5670163.1 CoA transferase [Corynebacterium sp.]